MFSVQWGKEKHPQIHGQNLCSPQGDKISSTFDCLIRLAGSHYTHTNKGCVSAEIQCPCSPPIQAPSSSPVTVSIRAFDTGREGNPVPGCEAFSLPLQNQGTELIPEGLGQQPGFTLGLARSTSLTELEHKKKKLLANGLVSN